MFDLDLRNNDRIVFIGSEQEEFFTKGKVYEVVSITSVKGKTHILLIDDSNEENCITVPFFRKNFRKVEVTIKYSEDGTFTTETDDGVLEWGVAKFYTEIGKLETLLDSLGVGYEEIIVE